MDQETIRGFLQLATELYGSQLAVCDALGQFSQRATRHQTGARLAPPQFNVYVKGKKEIPAWLGPAALALCELKKLEITTRYRRLLDKSKDIDLEEATYLLAENEKRHEAVGTKGDRFHVMSIEDAEAAVAGIDPADIPAGRSSPPSPEG